MAVEAQPEAVEITPHEREMINKVDTTEAQVQGQVDPTKAPEYTEPTTEPTEIDYKAEYEKLIASKDTPESKPETAKPTGLDIKEEDVTPPKEEPIAQTESLTPEAMGKYTQEFNTDGGLSEGSYEELTKLGLSKSVVDTYIQGQAAIQEAQTTKVYDTVGGGEKYGEMIEWAKENWSTEQVEVFNAQVNSGNDAQIMFGVEALANQFNGAKGSPLPTRALKGGSQVSKGSQNSFESKGEMMKAMNNSLYGKDASYTNMVANKVANSSF